METLIWVIQSFLALVFLYSGIMKSTKSERWLVAHNQTGVEGLSTYFIRFIGVSELLGAAGLILPWWLHIAMILTPVAAICMGLIMIPAAVIHYKRKEPATVLLNVMIFSLCVFVAVARFRNLTGS
jgi:uncharacterized membrane protein YphA (DoxX/SURF4 family)